MRLLLGLLLLATRQDGLYGFAPPSGVLPKPATTTTALSNAGGREAEKEMRKELADATFSGISETRDMAVADGANMEGAYRMPGDDDSLSDTPAQSGGLQATMDRMTKPRPYPLFLAEKFTEIAESTIGDVTKKLFGQELPDGQPGPREKIVVLGTGWGAATFLKQIDTSSRYDVTVISPRNYFLFTPMLAGARYVPCRGGFLLWQL